MVGERQVDMNSYNLPLDDVPEQWTARLVAKSNDVDEGVYLFPRDAEIFVDEYVATFPRDADGAGMGLELQELAGGREDGLGITVVSGLVEGGSAAGEEGSDAEIMPGDSISNVAVVRTSRGGGGVGRGLSDTEDSVSVRTECLGYDATVEAIGGLPPPRAGEMFVLTMKRLRRKPRVKVTLQYPPSQGEPDGSIEMFAGENLRLGMLVRGVKLNDPLAKRFDTKTDGNCGAGGLCRTCSVSVLKGKELLNPQKVAEKQMLEDNPRWRLACKAFVGYGMKEGEITLRVNPRQWEEDP
uniref:PDZ domain-containing protein n=2 Tax=Odontella aurita TaxID=265563 RepID=A0A7S4IYH3_9STRA|mmetsp:Transcript_33206/g.98696  ORF Transcript_33206/g.98696 Transcript_33206/m.98696 type:complete len:297 (+) Transcript_33206:220-1110(+)